MQDLEENILSLQKASVSTYFIKKGMENLWDFVKVILPKINLQSKCDLTASLHAKQKPTQSLNEVIFNLILKSFQSFPILFQKEECKIRFRSNCELDWGKG